LVRRYPKGNWCISGGIISLHEFIQEHRGALEYDLLKTGHSLADIGGSLQWGALGSFISHQNLDSAIIQETYPEYYSWGTLAKTNSLLADIYDMLAQINANVVGGFHRKAAKRTKPYPRPKKNNKDQKIGTAMPKDKLRKWMEEKRKKYLESQRK
jgi:hypothetical protein